MGHKIQSSFPSLSTKDKKKICVCFRFQAEKKKKKKKKKKIGMVGRNNILFCQNILFSR